jgi:hypothetical protein
MSRSYISSPLVACMAVVGQLYFALLLQLITSLTNILLVYKSVLIMDARLHIGYDSSILDSTAITLFIIVSNCALPLCRIHNLLLTCT